MMILLLMANPALANGCFHGDEAKFVTVEICRGAPNYCVQFCVSASAWDTPAAEATMFRFAAAVADGAASAAEFAEAFPTGIRAGTRKRFAGVLITTDRIQRINGTNY